MLKTLSLCLLLVMSSNLSLAEIYRCVDASGTVIFAGDPTLMPEDCKPEKLEGFAPPVSTQGTQPSSEDRKLIEKPAEQEPAPAQNDESLRSKAGNLVDQFTMTRRNVFRSPHARDKL